MEKSRRGIQSIEIGGKLLTTLVEAGAPMSLSELAKKAGMPAAKAHPYLVSFGSFGLIEQNPLTGRYELGPFALQIRRQTVGGKVHSFAVILLAMHGGK